MDSNMNCIPQELKELRQWVCYRIEERDGNPTKVPYRTDMVGRGHARPNDPSTWHTFDEVVDALSRPKNRFDGIGFVISKDDPYVFIDLDHVIKDGEIEPWAQEMIERVGSYTEYSRSGSGIHIIARAKKPGSRCRVSSKPKFEIYDETRLVVFTGRVWHDDLTQVTGAQQVTDEIYKEMFGDIISEEKGDSHAGSKGKRKKPSGGNLSDSQLIQKAMSASNGIKFSKLWNGNVGDYNGDASSADMALACMLAFYTDKDPGRMDKLFRMSGLMREKWDELRGTQTYAQITIDAAIGMTKETYGARAGRRSCESSGGGISLHGPDGEPLNDMGNARRLVSKHGETLRYCHDAGRWYCWDGRRWDKDESSDVVRKAKSVVEDMLKQAVSMRQIAEAENDTEGEELAKSFERHALSSGNHRRILAKVSQAESELNISILAKQLDSDKWALNCANGTVDLRSGVMHAHDRAELISKVSPIAYDPEAKCPTWEKFIAEIFENDEDLIRFVQQACGYTLTGDTREQLFFILHGCGSNGKSTFITALRDIWGDYETKTSTDTLVEKNNSSNTNDLAALRGARLVCAIETSAGKRLAESLVKELTGQDAVTARFLYQEFFTFVPVFKLWLACNHVPVVQGQDYGIWRRIRLIPFNVQFQDPEHPTGPYKDKSLSDKLRGEYEGVLAWLVRGCLDWQKDGLSTPKAVRAATGKLQQDMDVLGGFLGECCVFDKSAQTTAKELYSAYCQWADTNGEKPLSQRWFGLRLSERGNIESYRTMYTRFWRGITLSLGSSLGSTLVTSPDESSCASREHSITVPLQGGKLATEGAQGSQGAQDVQSVGHFDSAGIFVQVNDSMDMADYQNYRN